MQSKLKHRLLHTRGGQLSVLAGVMFFLLAGAAAFAWNLQGRDMLPIVVLVAGVCFISSLLALFVEAGFGGRSPILGLGLSILLRTGVPLIAAVTLKFLGGRFTEPSVLYYLLIFYFGSLITHVLISYSTSNDIQPIATPNRPTE
jgi:hypothetical protein